MLLFFTFCSILWCDCVMIDDYYIYMWIWCQPRYNHDLCYSIFIVCLSHIYALYAKLCVIIGFIFFYYFKTRTVYMWTEPNKYNKTDTENKFLRCLMLVTTKCKRIIFFFIIKSYMGSIAFAFLHGKVLKSVKKLTVLKTILKTKISNVDEIFL